MHYEAFPKIPRVSKSFFCTITEKIDGSNAQIVITDAGWDEFTRQSNEHVIARRQEDSAGVALNMRIGSRNRWIKPGKETDNYGFAGWCENNAEELFKLGIGRHFGEWYGNGIQCGYGLKEKRFALFNARRWAGPYAASKAGHAAAIPNCVEVVPVLYQGVYSQDRIDAAMDYLRIGGSQLVQGFMAPEGIIVQMGDELAKHTFMHSDGKWLSAV